jgi:hypothetical protein
MIFLEAVVGEGFWIAAKRAESAHPRTFFELPNRSEAAALQRIASLFISEEV